MSALRTSIQRALTRSLTSPGLQNARRSLHALWRTLRARQPEVHYFHQADDPYSHLAALHLQAFAARYKIRLVAHLVPAPDPAAAPDRERLSGWSARDAQRLAQSWGMPAPDFAQAPDAAHLKQAQAAMAAVLAQPNMPQRLAELSDALWRGAPIDTESPGGASALATAALNAGGVLRQKLGHYLGATFYFEGEWYWGMDRLHYLEQRLQQAGLAHAACAQAALVPARTLQLSPPPIAQRARPTLHFYCSLRSPYTHLAARQVRLLAAHYGADLHIRFVLPMVMRGLPVPLAKRLYIMRDTKREADRLGIPFGCVVDPVGAPTERGLALLHQALAQGRGAALAESFLQGVFAEGLDAGSDGDLWTIAERAGLAHADVGPALADPSWRTVAEANRTDMLARGLWGVPSFRVNDGPAVWGQDRLWMVEQDLIAALQ